MKLFKFEKRFITDFIEYELKTISKFKEPLNYIIKNLTKLGHSLTIKSLDKKIDLNKAKEQEGKNYNWSVFTYENVTLVIRRYKQHLTIFTKTAKGVDYMKSPKIEYGAFTLNTDFDKFEYNKRDEMRDLYYNEPFTDLNIIIKDLLKLLLEKDGGVHWVWNSASLKRPDHVKIELIFDGKSISSLDNFAFCMEEIDNIFLQLFSEITMLEKLKEFKNKIGKKLNDRYIIGKVTTAIKNEYYHDAGMEIIDTMNKSEKSFQDVYSLTSWYFEDIFKEKIYLYDGEIYIEGGEFKIGEPVVYKDIDEDNVTIFQKDFVKEKLIPLKKY